MKRVWSKLPSRWIREGALRAFRNDGALGSAAALKLYMALALFAPFKPSPSAEVAGRVRLSYAELEALCAISRRYVSLGLGILKARGLITVQPIGLRLHYLLSGFEETGWAKLPRGYLLEERRFASMGIRGGLYLNALKLYLALLTFRENESRDVRLSYDKIEHYTGIPRPQIRRAIDVLINHEWLSIASHVSAARELRPINVYVLRGDFWGRTPSNYVRASTATRGLPP